ncbi:hypothetical protein BC831DRAFT_457892 [Entophlyctis helioformis]|nr:hypothetical protein BC831DRAFT_457892 [Entophlyctis helioformis]
MLIPMPTTAVTPVTPVAVKIRAVDPSLDSRVLSSQYRSELNAKDVAAIRATYNQGIFTREERKRIDTAVDAYLAENGIPREDLHYLIHRRTKIKNGADADTAFAPRNPYSDNKYSGFIAAVREASAVNRSVDQVYWFMSRAYSLNRTDRRRWTPEEDAALLHLVETKGQRWKEIERELGLSDVKARWKKLQVATGEVNGGRWTDEESALLIKAMNEIMAREGITDVRKINFWTEAAAKVGTRTDNQCRAKWNTDIIRRKGEEPKTRMGFRETADMLTRMLTMCSAAADDSEVIWDALLMPNEPWTSQMYRQRWSKLQSHIPEEVRNQLSFSDIIQYTLTNLRQLMAKKGNALTSEYVDEDDAEDD